MILHRVALKAPDQLDRFEPGSAVAGLAFGEDGDLVWVLKDGRVIFWSRTLQAGGSR